MRKYEKRDRKRDNSRRSNIYFLNSGEQKARIAKEKNGHRAAAASQKSIICTISSIYGHDNWGVHSFPVGGADINHGPFIPPFVGAAPRGVQRAGLYTDVSLSYLAWTAALGTCWPGHINFTCRTPLSSCKIHPSFSNKLSSRVGLLSSPRPRKRPLAN